MVRFYFWPKMKSNAISSIALGQSESLFNSIDSSSNKQAKIYRDRQRERERERLDIGGERERWTGQTHVSFNLAAGQVAMLQVALWQLKCLRRLKLLHIDYPQLRPLAHC